MYNLAIYFSFHVTENIERRKLSLLEETCLGLCQTSCVMYLQLTMSNFIVVVRRAC